MTTSPGFWMDCGPRCKVRIKDKLVHVFLAEGAEGRIVTRSNGQQFVADGAVVWKAFVMSTWRQGWRQQVAEERSFDLAVKKLDTWVATPWQKRWQLRRRWAS